MNCNRGDCSAVDLFIQSETSEGGGRQQEYQHGLQAQLLVDAPADDILLERRCLVRRSHAVHTYVGQQQRSASKDLIDDSMSNE